MPFSVQYVKSSPEKYKTVHAKKDGEVQKYKMTSMRNKPIEYPNNTIIQSITKRFMTQRGLEPIYSPHYGVDWARFVGRSMDADLVVTIEQEITEALMLCEYVEKVNVKVSALAADKVIVNCEVYIKDEYTVSSKNSTVVLSTELDI